MRHDDRAYICNAKTLIQFHATYIGALREPVSMDELGRHLLQIDLWRSKLHTAKQLFEQGLTPCLYKSKDKAETEESYGESSETYIEPLDPLEPYIHSEIKVVPDLWRGYYYHSYGNDFSNEVVEFFGSYAEALAWFKKGAYNEKKLRRVR